VGEPFEDAAQVALGGVALDEPVLAMAPALIMGLRGFREKLRDSGAPAF